MSKYALRLALHGPMRRALACERVGDVRTFQHEVVVRRGFEMLSHFDPLIEHRRVMDPSYRDMPLFALSVDRGRIVESVARDLPPGRVGSLEREMEFVEKELAGLAQFKEGLLRQEMSRLLVRVQESFPLLRSVRWLTKDFAKKGSKHERKTLLPVLRDINAWYDTAGPRASSYDVINVFRETKRGQGSWATGLERVAVESLLRSGCEVWSPFFGDDGRKACDAMCLTSNGDVGLFEVKMVQVTRENSVNKRLRTGEGQLARDAKKLAEFSAEVPVKKFLFAGAHVHMSPELQERVRTSLLHRVERGSIDAAGFVRVSGDDSTGVSLCGDIEWFS